MFRILRRRSRTEMHEPAAEGPMVEEEIVEEEQPWEPAAALAALMVTIVAILTLLTESALGFRLGFKVASANEGNNFVDFIYGVTDQMIRPFTGIIESRSVDSGVFEPAIIIAMVVYLVLAVFLIALIRMVMYALGPRGGRPVTIER
ncbi:MAG: hypothetical protein QME71_10335 [Dehalococcoidia bacterium]|nr:hypothetical protein [Dehalococcoidia bacterium]